jgi:hypothetical protein
MRKCAFSVIKCFKAITADFGLNMDNVNDISEFGQQERGVPLVNAGKLKEKKSVQTYNVYQGILQTLFKHLLVH